MSDFVFLFRSDEAAARAAMGSPERAQQIVQTWLAWMRELETRGHLKNPGQPLERTGKVQRAVTLTAPEHVAADIEDYEVLPWSPAMAPIVLDPSSVEELLWGGVEAA